MGGHRERKHYTCMQCREVIEDTAQMLRIYDGLGGMDNFHIKCIPAAFIFKNGAYYRKMR